MRLRVRRAGLSREWVEDVVGFTCMTNTGQPFYTFMEFGNRIVGCSDREDEFKRLTKAVDPDLLEVKNGQAG